MTTAFHQKVITVASLKGGSGKTTTALYLAHYINQAGHSTLVLDADPTGTATRTIASAQDAGHPLDFPVRPVNLALLNPAVFKDYTRGFEYVIIDTPPLQKETVEASIAVADFVVITCKPNKAEAGRAMDIANHLDQAYGILVTQTWATRRSTKDIPRYLRDQGGRVLPMTIPDLATIQKTIYDGVWEKQSRYDDLSSFVQEIMETMERMKQEGDNNDQ